MTPRRAFVVVGTLALAVRVAYVLIQTRLAPLDVSFVASDSLFYLKLADAIRAGHGLSVGGEPTAFVGPVYPLFLAALGSVGAGPLAIGLVQAVLGAATACIAGLMALLMERGRSAGPVGRRGTWTILVAGGVCALYPHLVFWTGYVLTETLFVFLLATSAFCAMRALGEGRPALGAASGALGAIASLTRPSYLAIALVLLAWLTIAAVRGRTSRAVPILFTLALLLPLAMWTMRNAVELGGPVVTTTESGFVLYQANSADSNGGSRGYLDGKDYAPLGIPQGLGERERDGLYLARTIADIRADPGAWLLKTGPKVWNMWRPTYEGSSLRNGAITLLTYVPLLALGIVGAVGSARRDLLGPAAFPLLAFLAWAVAHAVVGGIIRYRLPAELLLIPCVPAGLALLLQAVPRSRSATRNAPRPSTRSWPTRASLERRA